LLEISETPAIGAAIAIVKTQTGSLNAIRNGVPITLRKDDPPGAGSAAAEVPVAGPGGGDAPASGGGGWVAQPAAITATSPHAQNDRIVIS
jgi:hypothetical protein